MQELIYRCVYERTYNILIYLSSEFYGASNGDIGLGGTIQISDLRGPKVWSDFEKIRQNTKMACNLTQFLV